MNVYKHHSLLVPTFNRYLTINSLFFNIYVMSTFAFYMSELPLPISFVNIKVGHCALE